MALNGTGQEHAKIAEPPYLVLEQEPLAILESVEKEAFLKELDGGPVEGLDFEGVTAKKYALPFYRDIDLIEAESPGWEPKGCRLVYLQHNGNLYWLNGTSPPIHEVNAKGPIRLEDGNVLDYLCFFCFFVRGEEGPFLAIDRPDNPFVPESVREQAEDVFRPPQIWGKDEKGNWRVSALIYYSNALFHSDFLVHTNGRVEMVEDVTVAADLPAKVEAPLVPEKPD